MIGAHKGCFLALKKWCPLQLLIYRRRFPGMKDRKNDLQTMISLRTAMWGMSAKQKQDVFSDLLGHRHPLLLLLLCLKIFCSVDFVNEEFELTPCAAPISQIAKTLLLLLLKLLQKTDSFLRLMGTFRLVGHDIMCFSPVENNISY